MRIYEGQQIPWWGRRWKVNYWDNSAEVLPIPICWIASLVYKLWRATFRFTPSTWAHKLRLAYKTGHSNGYSDGYRDGNTAGLGYNRAIAMHAAQEAAEDLLVRIATLSAQEEP